MRIACVSYRKWALSIYDHLASSTDHTFLIIRSRAQYNEDVIRDFDPDLLLFYGWSWIVPDSLIDSYKCLMLHPSPLPRYRGGSPIQNQIILGETESQVTIFIMNNEIDAGDIVAQSDLSLVGTLDDIFCRIEDIGYRLTLDLLENGLFPVKQDASQASTYQRRLPKDSEITIEELKTMPAEYLFNKIRMLADPYPNAFITAADGKRLYILASRLDSL